MKRVLAAAFLAALAVPAVQAQPAGGPGPYANDRDLASAGKFAAREADWRCGAIVYQVLVDRFVPPKDLEAKRALYPAPKQLRSWDETPRKGTFVDAANVWSHEIEFWGGDLDGVQTKLDHVAQFADVLYLNPIHLAYTNHKYDAQDYFKVSPEFGTREDVVELAKATEEKGLKLVLDGVLNHMGRTSPFFQEAMADPRSPWREWYCIGPQYGKGYRAWVNVPNLPEVNLESETVRSRLWGDPDSVIQGYLRDGVDGWRLDVAFDIGFRYLDELTRAAHAAKPGSLIIGEIWNYPEEWIPSVDGVMNMTLREQVLAFCRGQIHPATAGRQIERMVEDVGMDGMLRSWWILDNHDTPRLRNLLAEEWQQRMAQTLQFTLPGSPCVYYGVEVGMTGGDDPEQRGPMRWDLANDSNPQYVFQKKLVAMRRGSRALRIGDFRLLDTRTALGFLRRTDRVEEMRMVLANPTDQPAEEFFPIRDSKIMSYARFRDEFSGTEATVMAGTLAIEIPPRTIRVFRPVIERGTEYTPYKRVQ
jgi:glycosidase